MEQLLQKPFFKAVPLITMILILVNNSLSKTANALPAWISITGFIILTLLNIGIIVANYRSDKKKNGYKLYILGFVLITVAIICFFQLSNR